MHTVGVSEEIVVVATTHEGMHIQQVVVPVVSSETSFVSAADVTIPTCQADTLMIELTEVLEEREGR